MGGNEIAGEGSCTLQVELAGMWERGPMDGLEQVTELLSR